MAIPVAASRLGCCSLEKRGRRCVRARPPITRAAAGSRSELTSQQFWETFRKKAWTARPESWDSFFNLQTSGAMGGKAGAGEGA